MWVITAFSDLSVEQCESVLRLKADTFTLIALEKQIREKYYALFDVDDEKMVSMRSDDIREYLDKEDKDAPNDNSSAHHQPHASEHVALEEGEIALVKRLLKTHFNNIFGGEDLYDRFGFEAFFESKLGDQAVRIHLETFNVSHVRLAQACLVAICDKFDDEEYASFRTYAYEWFADHLRAITNNDDIDIATKQDVGRKLVRVLREPEFIEAWWEKERMFLRSYWVYGTSCLDPVFKCLSDPVVQRGLLDMPSERQWVISATSDNTSPTQLLVNVAKHMAQKWYEQSGLSSDAFWWLYGYHNQKGEQPPDMYDDVTPADVERIEQWAKETISDTDDQAQWHKCMAETLIDTGNFLAAIPRTREAIKLRPNDWRLKFSLVESQFLAKDPKSALESIENLFKDHGALLDNSADEYYEFYHRTLLPYYGNLQRELKDYAAAETTYSDLLKEAMKRPDIDGLFQESLVHMINILRLQHKHEDVLQFLRDLDAQAHKKEGGSWLTAAMYFYSPHGELHEPIWDSARRLGQLEFLEERYRKALEVHVSEPEGDVEWVIHLYLGFCHSCVLRATATPENRLRALEELEENLYRPLSEELKDNYNVEEVMALHTVRLAVDLLDMAKENGLSLPLSPEAARYAARLEKLTQLRSQQDYQDPHLTLARFWHLAGDEKRAKDAVREYLQHGMEWMRTMDNFKNGVYRLAVTLQAVDDDVNATAAWSLFWPTRMNDDGEFVLNYVDDEEAMKELAEVKSKSEGTTAVSREPAREAVEEQAVAGAEREDTDEQSLDQRKPATPENPADDPEPAKPATPKPQKLEGFLTSSCDGDCDIKWTYIDRTIYSCKDCLDVQFEEGCYKKLLAGELNTTVCSPKHTHLVIPAFDLEKWKELPDPSKQCWVGGEIRGDKEWSEGIKIAWGIDEESLKKKRRFVEGVRKVQRLWRVRRKVGKEGEEKMGAGTGMLVRRGTSFQNHLAGAASGVVSPA